MRNIPKSRIKILSIFAMIIFYIMGNSVAWADCNLLTDDSMPLCQFVNEYGVDEALNCGDYVSDILIRCGRHPCELFDAGADLNELISNGAQTGELLECAYGCELYEAGIAPGEIIDEGYIYELTDCLGPCELHDEGADLSELEEIGSDVSELLWCTSPCELMDAGFDAAEMISNGAEISELLDCMSPCGLMNEGADLNEIINAGGELSELLGCSSSCDLVDAGADLGEVVNQGGDINELLGCSSSCDLVDAGADLGEVINQGGDINELLGCSSSCDLVDAGADLGEVVNQGGDINELQGCASSCDLVNAGADLGEVINQGGDINELLGCASSCDLIDAGADLSEVINRGGDINELLNCSTPCEILSGGAQLNEVVDAGADIAEVLECASPCEVVESGVSVDVNDLMDSGATVDELIGCAGECDLYSGGGNLSEIINAGGDSVELLGCASSCEVYNAGGDLSDIAGSGGDIGELITCAGACEIIQAGGDLNDVINAGAQTDDLIECAGVEELANAGVSLEELINAGAEIEDLLGFAAPCDVRNAGAGLNTIINAGGSINELLNCSDPCEILSSGGSLEEIISSGGNINELLSCSNPCEIHAAGGDITEILNYSSVPDLLSCGTSACILAAEGVQVTELLSEGVPVTDLLACGVTVEELLAAGVNCMELKFAGIDRECGLGDPEDENGKEKPCGSPIWKVNKTNMNLHIADIPLWYSPAIGPSVNIHLSYNSHASSARNKHFGNKWTFNYGSYINVDAGGNVTVYMPDGGLDVFIPDGLGGYKKPFGVFNALTKIAENNYELQFLNGNVYAYNIASIITSSNTLLGEIRDAYNNKISLGYNNDLLETITDETGKVTFLIDNDFDGLIDRINDPFGRSAYFEYDINGNLTKVTDMGGYWSEFSYDANIFVESISNENETWSFNIEPADEINNGLNPYPAPGEAMWKNYRITVTNPLKYKEEYYYNHIDKYSWHVSPRDYIPYMGPDNNNYVTSPKTQFYLTDGNLRGRISKMQSPEGGYAEYSYDTVTGKTSTIIDYHSHRRQYTYNSKGLAAAITDAKGNVTTFIYSPNNIDVEKIQLDLGNTPEDDNIIIQTFTYNGNTHDIASVTDRLGNITEFNYNPHGQLTVVNQAKGTSIEMTTEMVYDHVSNKLTEIKKDSNTIASYTYDNIGRIETSIDSKGLLLEYDYDDLDRILKTTYPDTRFETLNYSSCCPRIIDDVTDRAGLTTSYTYDSLKRLTEVQGPTGIIKYRYDANDNMVKLIDADGKETAFNYDLDNRLIRKTYPGGKFIEYDYDPEGLIANVTNSRGIEINYSDYDEAHNLLTIDYSDFTPDVTYTYDNYERLESMTDGIGLHQYGYDDLNRLTSIDGPWNNDTIFFQYNELGNLKNLTPQGGQAITYNYDYDAGYSDLDMGRLKDIQAGTNTYTYNYTGANPLIQSFSRPKGSVTDYQHAEPLNRLTEITNKTSAEAIISKHVFTYNNLDLIDTETMTTGTPITSFQEGLTTYNYNNLNQLMSSTNPAETFNYDDDGNMTQGYTPAGHQFTAAYDAENRLISLSFNDGATDHESKYYYNGDSFPAKEEKYENSIKVDETRFIRAGFLPIQERDGNNTVMREYTWGLNIGGGIGGLLNLNQNGVDYSYLYDGKGNVMALIDSSQTVVASYRYDVFGLIKAKTGSLDQPYQFSTKRYDESTGLSDYGYRFYSPITGRWINRDPLGEAGGINLYQMVGNNPVNFVDPWGLWKLSLTGYTPFYGLGGGITIGENSDGLPFLTFRLGVGYGGGVSFDPDGTSPGYDPCDNFRYYGGATVGAYGDVGLVYRGTGLSLDAAGGYVFTPGAETDHPYFGIAPNISVGSGWRFQAGGGGGIEIGLIN